MSISRLAAGEGGGLTLFLYRLGAWVWKGCLATYKLETQFSVSAEHAHLPGNAEPQLGITERAELGLGVPSGGK
jgi:hypothetical protein